MEHVQALFEQLERAVVQFLSEVSEAWCVAISRISQMSQPAGLGNSCHNKVTLYATIVAVCLTLFIRSWWDKLHPRAAMTALGVDLSAEAIIVIIGGAFAMAFCGLHLPKRLDYYWVPALTMAAILSYIVCLDYMKVHKPTYLYPNTQGSSTSIGYDPPSWKFSVAPAVLGMTVLYLVLSLVSSLINSPACKTVGG